MTVGLFECWECFGPIPSPQPHRLLMSVGCGYRKDKEKTIWLSSPKDYDLLLFAKKKKKKKRGRGRKSDFSIVRPCEEKAAWQNCTD